jgi:hypothetical protein
MAQHIRMKFNKSYYILNQKKRLFPKTLIMLPNGSQAGVSQQLLCALGADAFDPAKLV